MLKPLNVYKESNTGYLVIYANTLLFTTMMIGLAKNRVHRAVFMCPAGPVPGGGTATSCVPGTCSFSCTEVLVWVMHIPALGGNRGRHFHLPGTMGLGDSHRPKTGPAQIPNHLPLASAPFLPCAVA